MYLYIYVFPSMMIISHYWKQRIYVNSDCFSYTLILLATLAGCFRECLTNTDNDRNIRKNWIVIDNFYD